MLHAIADSYRHFRFLLRALLLQQGNRR